MLTVLQLNPFLRMDITVYLQLTKHHCSINLIKKLTSDNYRYMDLHFCHDQSMYDHLSVCPFKIDCQ